MRRGSRFAADQAEIVFSEVFVEQLEALSEPEVVDVLTDVQVLCRDPAGKHPLSRDLAGWNALEVLTGHKRVVYKASEPDGVGLVEVLCLGPRSDSAVYDMAAALRDSGALTVEEVTQVWEALSLLDVVAERVGLDGWDFRPPPAPEGMIRAAVAAGVLEMDVARLLSQDEIEAALTGGWGPRGPDPRQALRAALERARSNVGFHERQVIERRADDRCEALMPRAQAHCIRRAGHPGPHRAR